MIAFIKFLQIAHSNREFIPQSMDDFRNLRNEFVDNLAIIKDELKYKLQDGRDVLLDLADSVKSTFQDGTETALHIKDSVSEKAQECSENILIVKDNVVNSLNAFRTKTIKSKNKI
jgi:hypothetical protein